MAKKKRKFITKKNALVFNLVHRSQHDPLAVDENAPQYVLKECSGEKNKEEEQKYGIFFDDEYNYMQHLKSLTEPITDWEQVNYKIDDKPKNFKTPEKQVKVLLPSSVFQSDFEESVGYLNKAAPIYGPRLDIDPEIVAALDDDFDFNNPDNILEDNFIEIANQISSGSSIEDYDEFCDKDELQSELSFDETKSLFTDYSLSSSVIRRNEQLTLLDNHFEKVFQKYNDNDVGCLPLSDIEGTCDIENLQVLVESEVELKPIKEDIKLKKKILQAATKLDSIEEEIDLIPVNDTNEKWDCMSILSTYSNLYNHPAKIKEKQNSDKIVINKKTGVPMDILGNTKLTPYALSKLNQDDIKPQTKSIVSLVSELSIRPKNETTDEKKIRKQNIKEYRRERRQEKKANKLAFTVEKCRQEKNLANFKSNQGKIKLF